MKSLDQLRNAFKTPDHEGGERMPNNYFPFWNMNEGDQAIVRFLPDANEDNPMGFLVEKVTHQLEINGEKKVVPCLSMYGEDCPICALSKSYYDAEDKVNGKKYWKKRQYIAQALVIEDPLPLDPKTNEDHVGKVRYMAMGFQLFNIIKEAFESGDLDEAPFAYEGGTNFIIKKSKQGEYASYALGSKFARKSTDLPAEITDELELVDLSTLLPPHPGRDKVEAMLSAAVTGAAYGGDDNNAGSDNAAFEKAVKAKVAASSAVDEPAPAAASANVDDEADDILAQIRQRRAAKASAE